ncbi:MAG TPA: SGNH/GDSL hydrolase family protein [Candidatus Ornithomonoglobus intestinigallinarum]|uniref:SGNH/GDSL hydrolase family protein n=1 Tax=Candidatus Ornithomonoglobus intestinigallinarum TaxID=2840894 RepID=A0A9D1H2E6_9FIRM|nr:SGNH/GDSL hydrolase family protein [Candidatus Ornithomonoglobus intestinigallinarum]
MELKNKTIAFLGDSITFGVGASAPDKVYHSLIKEKYGLKEALNFGVSGTRFAKQHTPSADRSFDETFITRAKRIPADVDAVIVFGGTNDYGHGDAPFGKFSDRTDETFCGACHVLMSYLADKFAGKPVIFMTPLHRTGEEGKSINGVVTQFTLKDYVDAIKRTAEYYAVPVLDLFAESGMQPNIESHNNYFFVDGLHPNDNGYKQIAGKLGKYLENF